MTARWRALAAPASSPPALHIALQIAGACVMVLVTHFFLPFTLPDKGGDDAQYVMLARDLAFGGGELYRNRPDASLHFPPGYPFLLSLFVERDSLGWAPLVQRIYYGLTVVLAAGWATLTFGAGVGWTVFGLVAMNPALLGSSSMLASEGPHVILYMIGFMAWMWFLRTQRVAALALCAFSLALAAFVRGYGLLLLVFLPVLLMLALRKEPWQRVLRYVAIYLAIWAVVLAPWAIRNYRVWHHFVLMTTPGTTIYSAWFPPAPLAFGRMANDDVSRQANQITDHFEQDRFYVQAAAKRILDEPGLALTTTLQKYALFVMPFDWEFFGRYNAEGRLRPSLHYIYIFMLPFLLLYIWRHRRSEEFWWGPMAPVLYGLVMTALILGIPRFRLCVEPLLMGYAAAALVGWAGENRVRWSAAGGYFVVCLVSAYVFMKLVE
ncbi:MAG: hypothetical protein EPO61_01030 [Nitrospirae bacterium]|nr:MAG: hypothetical protein EPO61_01030 [Nitrospirota bacterium]